MNPMLTVFIDGLKPESIEHMEFLDTFENKRRIRTELGYSNLCHASMYSGVYPNKHLKWFVWMYSPKTSPFKWIEKLGIQKLPHNIYTKYACYRISKSFRRVRSFYGIPYSVWYLPVDLWHYFDVAEKKFWTDPGYLEDYPTIFEILVDNGVDYEVVGMTGNLAESSKSIKKHTQNHIKPWTYYFIGDIDPLSHQNGQDSPETIARLKTIDKILEEKYKEIEKRIDDFSFILFSDHGHIKVENKVDISSFFRSNGKILNSYIHFIDSNYARFWFRNQKERKEIEEVLLKMDDKGFILNDELLKKYHVDMSDNRYGDLIFYLDTPNIFDHGKLVVMGKQMNSSPVSMHGYLPDHSESDGVFISNRKIINESHVRLEDITPTILEVQGLKIPDYMDGEVIWKK